MPQQGRAKACTSCVKSKKRCDLQTPVCSRCKDKALHCEYNNGKNGTLNGESKEHDEWNGSLWTDQYNLTPVVTSIDAGSNDNSAYLHPDNVMYPQQVNVDQQLADHASLMSIGTNLIESQLLVENMDDKTLKLMTTIFCSYPRIFIQRLELSFINHSLYANNMPEVMQNAIKICALYTCKTSENEAIIFTMLNAEVDKLYAAPETFLASTHALLFYQIISLFDGNIRQRALGEQRIGLLNSWADKLRDSAPSEICQDWQGWIVQQTICRTIIVIRFLDLMYGMIRDQDWYRQDRICFSAVETNVRIWKARTTCEWAQAKMRSVPVDLFCTADLEVQIVETIDPFRLLLLTATQGIHFMEKWARVEDFTQMMLRLA